MKQSKLFRERMDGDNLTEITLPDGRKEVAQFIDRGSFSHVFRLTSSRNSVIIYTQHGDLSKDILSHVDRKNNNHIPPMNYLGPMLFPLHGKLDVYRSRFYETKIRKNRNVSNKVWKMILALRLAHAEACTKFTGNIVAKNECIDFNYFIADHADVPAKLKEALLLITESAQDWGKCYIFDDFRAKNLGLDKQGRLVLIDPLFDAEALQKTRGV